MIPPPRYHGLKEMIVGELSWAISEGNVRCRRGISVVLSVETTQSGRFAFFAVAPLFGLWNVNGGLGLVG